MPLPAEKLFFMHIPKTAGTSLFKILEEKLGDNVYGVDENITVQAAHQYFDVAHLNQVDWVGGHWDAGILKHDLAGELLPLTIFRHPLARTISHYIYIKNTLDDDNEVLHNVIHRQQLDLKGFLEHDPYHPEIWNPQTTQLAGVKWSAPEWIGKEAEVLQLALQNLQKFIFVGLQERFPESILLICHCFGWQPPETFPRLNTTKEIAPNLSSEAITAIQTATQLDSLIYEHAKHLYNQHLLRFISDSLQLPNLPPPTIPLKLTPEKPLYAKKIFYTNLYQRLHAHLSEIHS